MSKGEEKQRKLLTDIRNLPENKRCMDCQATFSQYCVLDFGTWVCATCSGIHREFCHKVKSPTMGTFKPEQIELLRKGGNQVARKLWRANWNPKEYPEPSPDNIVAIREFIRLTYIEKRWYASSSTSSTSSPSLSSLSSEAGNPNELENRSPKSFSKSNTDKVNNAPPLIDWDSPIETTSSIMPSIISSSPAQISPMTMNASANFLIPNMASLSMPSQSLGTYNHTNSSFVSPSPIPSTPFGNPVSALQSSPASSIGISSNLSTSSPFQSSIQLSTSISSLSSTVSIPGLSSPVLPTSIETTNPFNPFASQVPISSTSNVVSSLSFYAEKNSNFEDFFDPPETPPQKQQQQQQQTKLQSLERSLLFTDEPSSQSKKKTLTPQANSDMDSAPRCPLCDFKFSSQTSNEAINKHIDECLNSNVIEDTLSSLKEQNLRTKSEKVEKKSSLDKSSLSKSKESWSQSLDLSKMPWYYGGIDRQEAERILNNCKQNSFLVRKSSIKDSYALSLFNWRNRTIAHTLIVPRNGGYGFKDSLETYPTLIELVNNSSSIVDHEPPTHLGVDLDF